MNSLSAEFCSEVLPAGLKAVDASIFLSSAIYFQRTSLCGRIQTAVTYLELISLIWTHYLNNKSLQIINVFERRRVEAPELQ